MTTLSTNTLSVLTAVQGADAAGTGSVLYDPSVAENSEAALVETFLAGPEALPEAVQIRAQMLMGKLQLGRWTTAGDLRFFDNPQTVRLAALAVLKRSAHSAQCFVDGSVFLPRGGVEQLRAAGPLLHAAGGEAAVQPNPSPASPLAPCKTHTGVQAKHSPEELFATLEEVGWIQSEAGRRLGITQSTISHRLRHAHQTDPNSLLGRVYQKVRERLAEVKRMREQAGPRRRKRKSKAKPSAPPRSNNAPAVRRNLVAELLQARLLAAQAAPDASPLALQAKDRITDALMAELLGYFYNIETTAMVLQVSPDVIRLRLRLLREHPEWRGQSPLLSYLDFK